MLAAPLFNASTGMVGQYSEAAIQRLADIRGRLRFSHHLVHDFRECRKRLLSSQDGFAARRKLFGRRTGDGDLHLSRRSSATTDPVLGSVFIKASDFGRLLGMPGSESIAALG